MAFGSEDDDMQEFCVDNFSLATEGETDLVSFWSPENLPGGERHHRIASWCHRCQPDGTNASHLNDGFNPDG